MEQNNYIKCGDCYAHYPNGNLHICDPLMKALVEKKKRLSCQHERTDIKEGDKHRAFQYCADCRKILAFFN